MSITVKSRVISEGDIRAGLAEGLTDSQIGALHGYPTRHVADQRRKHGLRASVPANTLYTEDDVALIRRMKRDGAAIEDIASALGRSVGATTNKIVALGLHGVGTRGVRGGRGSPIGREATDAAERARDRRASTLHMIDLLRAFGGGEVWRAKALYRARHEYSIPAGQPDPALSRQAREYHSACSSPAGWAS